MEDTEMRENSQTAQQQTEKEEGYDPRFDPNAPEFDSAALWAEASEQEKESERLYPRWEKEAVKGVLFPPDRRRVRAELEDHFQDRVDSLLACGVPAPEARRRAVAMLGDPTQIGKLLASVHKPWLGWALRALRILLAVLALALLINNGSVRSFLSEQINLYQYLRTKGSVEGRVSKAENAVWRVGSCDTVWQAGEFRISVPDAGSCYIVSRDVEGIYRGKDHGSYALLRFQAPPWRKPDPGYVAQNVWIEDEYGRRYRTVDQYGRSCGTEDTERDWKKGMLEGDGTLSCSYVGQDLSASYFLLTISESSHENETDYSDARSMEIHLRFGESEKTYSVRFGPRQQKGDICNDAERDIDKLVSFYTNEWPADNRTIRLSPKGAGPANTADLKIEIPAAREIQRSADSTAANPAELQIFVTLRGELEDLPLTKEEALCRLSLTAADGIRYPIGPVPNTLFQRESRLSSYIWVCEGGVVLQLVVGVEESSEYYDLHYEHNGTQASLRISMEEVKP